MAVEVVVRIGDVLHEVAYVRDGTYRAAVCDIDIADVRAGLSDRKTPLVIERGLATITLRLVDAPCGGLPRKRADRRPLVYHAGSLALHIGVWLAAILYGATELAVPSVATSSDRGNGRRARIAASFASAAQTVKRTDKPEPTEAPITTDPTPAQQPSPERDETGGPQARHGAPPQPVTRGNGDAEPMASEAGRQRRFDPGANPEFDTVKVGSFSTVSRGRQAGEHYGGDSKRSGMIVVSCDASTCIVLGGENAAPIRKVVEENLKEITGCYAHASDAAGKKLEIDFGVDESGKVDDVQLGGVGDVGDCVANIIKRARFHEPSSLSPAQSSTTAA